MPSPKAKDFVSKHAILRRYGTKSTGKQRAVACIRKNPDVERMILYPNRGITAARIQSERWGGLILYPESLIHGVRIQNK